MKTGDLVMLTIGSTPHIGEIVGFTPKRIRIAFRNGGGYISVLRAKSSIALAKRRRGLI